MRTAKANYLARRLETESWLISQKQRLVGDTRLIRPIYFFLGNFADEKDISRPRSLVMPLAMFPSEILTFTYPEAWRASQSRPATSMSGNAITDRCSPWIVTGVLPPPFPPSPDL